MTPATRRMLPAGPTTKPAAGHSATASHEYNQEDWAAWEQHSADDAHHTADAYAAEGDHDHAAQYDHAAADHQQTANDHGWAGEHDTGMSH